MSDISVQGLHSLVGEIRIQGSKNAVLPMMAASILHRGTTVITNVPRIQDVFCMLGILEWLGCDCSLFGNRLTIDASQIKGTEIPEQYGALMRSSVFTLGPLLGRMGQASAGLPGGCQIGRRPIDLHLAALRALGAEIREEDGHVSCQAKRLTGADIYFPFPSVGATENALMAAVLADGVTVIHGAAREPEIGQLCRFLNQMGANICGAGTSRLAVTGVKRLHDVSFAAEGDRIVAGTYLAAAMVTAGDIRMTRVSPSSMEAVLKTAEKMGAWIDREPDSFRVRMTGRPDAVSVKTGPYPGFPTDLQSPIMAVFSVSQGCGRIDETVFEGRFKTAGELRKMGADIAIEENRAAVHGLYPLKGASVEAKDLRGGAALVAAALAAEGETLIRECRHIERGYEDICRDLSSVGAVIRGIE